MEFVTLISSARGCIQNSSQKIRRLWVSPWGFETFLELY